MTILGVFGDSWPQGSELQPGEKNYGILLAEMLPAEKVYNNAAPGSSLTHLIVQLKTFLDQTRLFRDNGYEHTAVFFLTSQHRHMTWIDNRWWFWTPTGAVVPPGHDRDLATRCNEMHYKYFDSGPDTDIRINTTVLTCQAMCEKYRIKDYYIAGWQRFDFWPAVDLTRIYGQGQRSLKDDLGFDMDIDRGLYQDQNPYIYPNISHPNQAGHEKIAQIILDFIKNT